MRPALPMKLRIALAMGALVVVGVVIALVVRSRSHGAHAAVTPVVPLAPVTRVNPLAGTGTRHGVTAGDNNTFPGATLPFGMIQWSPDTEKGTKPAGYASWDKRISGFSVTHVSGAGCRYGGDFAFMPRIDATDSVPPQNRADLAQPFSHQHEVAKPGFYEVTLDNGLRVELTTTQRSGLGRFTFPRGTGHSIVLNAASDVTQALASEINVDVAHRSVSGWAEGGRFCTRNNTRKIYFYATFDRPIASFESWSEDKLSAGVATQHGKHTGVVLHFDEGDEPKVVAKVGLSYVSVAGARANLAAELPPLEFAKADFASVTDAASRAWNERLTKIDVSGGTPDDVRTFYTMLYHALIGPTVVSDVDGQYTGYDNAVHRVAQGRVQYGMFSGWDIYRSECQLLAILAPKEVGDMAESLLEDYRQGGAFPRWGVITEDSGVMIGDPAALMIGDFYAFGARDFDVKDALTGLVRGATDPTVGAPRSGTKAREALDDYLKLGFVPEHQDGKYGNVAMTLEYASADFAIAQLAEALGDAATAATLTKQSRSWENLYDEKVGYLAMRRRDGSFAPNFVDNAEVYDDGEFAYVEGSAAQYVWMVPFDLPALISKLGGDAATERRLDRFFVKVNAGMRGADATMAWMGNEPCLHVPWVYAYLGKPEKTSAVVRRVMTELYSSRETAYPGNDDVGELSSWYVFAALGMYPVVAGTDLMVLHGPLFPKVTIHLAKGDLTILGAGAKRGAPYVADVTWNGAPVSRSWMRWTDLAQGGTLRFRMSEREGSTWGTDAKDRPPSFRSTDRAGTGP